MAWVIDCPHYTLLLERVQCNCRTYFGHLSTGYKHEVRCIQHQLHTFEEVHYDRYLGRLEVGVISQVSSFKNSWPVPVPT